MREVDDSVHILKLLDQLSEKYDLSPSDLNLLEEIKASSVIQSIAFTSEGGFNPNDGEFYLKKKGISYKIRIKYQSSSEGEGKFLFLMPSV